MSEGNVSELRLTFQAPGTDETSYFKISNTIVLAFQWTVYTVVCLGIAIFGTVTNIINIICFVKQGFKDPVNVSLAGLALSDLGCLITQIWTNLCMNPAFNTADLPFESIEFAYLTGGFPHATFTRITSWITALITLERCLCVIAPLKINRIVTSKRVSIIIVVVFVILISCIAPMYVVNRYDTRFYPNRNRTLLGLYQTADREGVERISMTINNAFIPFFAFLVIIICTVVLVVKLHHTTKWRKKSAIAGQAENISNRNQKVTKMVVMISTLFIVCFIPVSINFIAMTLEPELSIGGRHVNILIIIMGLGFVLETINSSLNIFIYYHMSSKFRSIFRHIFCKGADKNIWKA